MNTNSEGAVPVTASGKDLPEFSLRIRETRKACRLTQAKFAKTLRTTRATVARWEIGNRQPNAENYAALGQFAQQNSLASSRFFLERENARKVSSQEKREGMIALLFLEDVEQLAKGGAEHYKRLLEQADRDPVEVVREYHSRLVEINGRLANGAFRDAVKALSDGYEAIKRIWDGRKVRAAREAELQRRMGKRLLALQRKFQRDLSEATLTGNRIVDILNAGIRNFLEKLSPHAQNDTVDNREVIKWHFRNAIGVLLMPALKGLETSAEYRDYSKQLAKILAKAKELVEGPAEAADAHALIAIFQGALRLKPPTAKVKE